ncbi:MAG: N-acetylneuraminate synthase family protein [Chitinophagaceae bacterium]|nr:N-acetylneuraminate synthase family protein [Chitinophagaceae bacterium]
MKKPFSGKHGPLLIAEIGGNHEGDFDYACRLTELAIASDADFIKFQIYTGDTLVSRLESPQRNEHFKKFELHPEQHIALARMCEQAGKSYMASVWNPDFIEWIDPYMPVYKIGSGDLTAYPVLKRIASIGKPIILSTGLSTLEEVLAAVNYIQRVNGLYKSPDYLAILQCTSMYPIQPGDANLSVMHTLREATGLTIGYSDHTIGNKALEIAVAMGAGILEFHFTDVKEGRSFRDHQVSLTKEDVHQLIADIRLVELLKGDGVKRPLDIETSNGHELSFRRAVYPIRDITAGTIIAEQDLITLRPNHGIDARDFDKVIGKRINVSVKAHQKLEWDMFADK